MPDKYARDHDNMEAIIADARVTVGRLTALIEALSDVTAALRAETGAPPPEEEGDL